MPGPLLERYHVALFDYLDRMTGNRAAAGDLVQDVFVRILKYRATYRDGGSFETWLFRIAPASPVDFEVQVPARTNLRLSAMNAGDIVVEGDGDLEVDNSNSPITLTNVAGSMVADALNGNVLARLARVTAGKAMAFTSLNGKLIDARHQRVAGRPANLGALFVVQWALRYSGSPRRPVSAG